MNLTSIIMTIITIPKKITNTGDLVAIPRKEYEEFSHWRKTIERPRKFKTFKPTKAQLKDLDEARKERRRGIYLTIDELKQKLDITN